LPESLSVVGLETRQRRCQAQHGWPDARTLMRVDGCSGAESPRFPSLAWSRRSAQLLLGATHLSDGRADRFGRSA